jgi:hypothetical protein
MGSRAGARYATARWIPTAAATTTAVNARNIIAARAEDPGDTRIPARLTPSTTSTDRFRISESKVRHQQCEHGALVGEACVDEAGNGSRPADIEQ